MSSLIKLISEATLTALKAVAAVVVGLPLLAITILVPSTAWKPLIRLGLLSIVYRYVYPQRHPLSDTGYIVRFVTGYALDLYGTREAVWLWLNDPTHVALLTSIGAVIGFMLKWRNDAKKDRRALAAKLDRHRPDLTADFTLSDEHGMICTLINIGGGTAISVRFRLYVLDSVRTDDEGNVEGVHIRVRRDVLQSDDPTQIWRIRDAHEYPYILPHAQQPKAMPLGILTVEPGLAILVEAEYTDTLDRRFYQYAYGGQSSEHTTMGISKWHYTEKKRYTSQRSGLRDVLTLTKFYIAKVNPIKAPMIESEGGLMQAKVRQWLDRERAKHES